MSLKYLKEEQKFFENYNKLNSLSLKILQFTALLYEKTPENKFYSLLLNTEIIKADETTLAKDIIDKLVKHGSLKLIDPIRPSFQIDKDFRTFLFQEAHKNKELNFKYCQEIIQHNFSLVSNDRLFGSPHSKTRCKRDILFAFFNKDFAQAYELIQKIKTFFNEPDFNLYENILNPLNGDYLRTFPEDIIYNIFHSSFLHNIKNSKSFNAFNQADSIINEKYNTPYPYWNAIIDFMTGDSKRYLNYPSAIDDRGAAIMNFTTGNYDKAKKNFNNGFNALKEHYGKDQDFFNDFSDIFLILHLLKDGKKASLKYACAISLNSKKNFHYKILQYLNFLVMIKQGRRKYIQFTLQELDDSCYNLDILSYYFNILVKFLIDYELPKQDEILEFAKFAKTQGFHWIESELKILADFVANRLLDLEQIEKNEKKYGIKSFITLFKREEIWEQALNSLIDLNEGDDQNKTTRIAYYYDPTAYHSKFIVKEQIVGKNGAWTKGKRILEHRLLSFPKNNLTEHDIKIFKTAASYNYRTESFDLNKTFVALIGHPNIYLLSNSTHIEFIERKPEFIVKEHKNYFDIAFSDEFTQIGVVVNQVSPTKFAITNIEEKHIKVFQALGRKSQITIPIKAKKQLEKGLANIASFMNIQSNTDVFNSSIPSKESFVKPYIHIYPKEDGFKLSILSRPFGDEGPYFKPGKGHKVLVTDLEDGKFQTVRKLEKEKEITNEIIDNSEILTDRNQKNFEWEFDGPQECLEVLYDIDKIKDQVTLEWPKGEKLKITDSVSTDSMKLKIKKDRDWFGLSGELRVSDDLVLKMHDVMSMLQESNGRFIELKNGEFLALTKSFKQKLEEISAFSDFNKKSKELLFHNVAAFAIGNTLDDFNDIEVDDAWTKQISKIDKSKQFKPRIPSTLQADLRDYQVDGYKWLARLANLGLGACLADDMGLGKTLQALAIILQRSSKGPALVVAPASVCMNWANEINKFAPTLNPIIFRDGDRKYIIKKGKKKDIFICSYGLLQFESDLLMSKKWSTIVLDEAQAIKNRMTKRSKAAMQLQSDFKIITTGTPVENHLGELWNLINFINPGLLGSIKSFNDKFVSPIVKDNDKVVNHHLKKIVQPFILRRKKNDVLDELPPKTEITLSVELPEEERAFYEALRRDTIENLSGLNSKGPGNGHLQILAELMKLRRACCHPKLINNKLKFPGAKLTLFDEIVDDLIENKHKALVFSQFVGHLEILRKHLDKKKVFYQYLDGSTPVKKRQQRVDAFQNGEGELFLISLKAGGTGLNLTAADFVIHMDPWWNPAVEDQASDRVHRIGQTRPVTVYKLVTKDTIEEKIIRLHKEKKDLADSILEGTDKSGKLSANELLTIIKES